MDPLKKFSFTMYLRFGIWQITISRVRTIALSIGCMALAQGATATTIINPAEKAVASAVVSYGSTYRLDSSFATLIEATGGNINAVVATTDGGFLVGGLFSTISGQQHLGLAKFKSDGTIDSSFNQNGGCDGQVYSVAVQPDGRIIVGGRFTAFNGKVCIGIARLNADGTLDTTFSSGSGLRYSNFDGADVYQGEVYALGVQTDGRIVVGGNFTSYNGVARNKIVRLNKDGTIDTTFNSVAGSSAIVESLVVLQNGRILVGGNFDFEDSQNASHLCIARLNADGTVDASFHAAFGDYDMYVRSLLVQADGRILVGGEEGYYDINFNHQIRGFVGRMNADGTSDITFDSGTGIGGGDVSSLAVQADGRILVGGTFVSYNGTSCGNIARLNTNGTFDTSFNLGSGFDRSVNAIAVQANGLIVSGGRFTTFKGAPATNIARLATTGTLDTTLSIVGLRMPTSAKAVPLAGGKFIVGGAFNWVNGTACNTIARLNADGTLDTAFSPGTGFSVGSNGVFYIFALAGLPDGRILVGGNFTSFNGMTCNGIARLNADGTLDSSFNSGTGFDRGSYYAPVNKIEAQADGHIVVGGTFTTYNGTSRKGILRLNSNGSLDTSFNPAAVFYDGVVDSFAVQSDSRIVISGAGIARLNASGALDTTFHSVMGGDISSVAMQADGKVLASGNFVALDGSSTQRKTVARLSADGTLDSAFNCGSSFILDSNPVPVDGFAVQSDGKIVAGGNLTTQSSIEGGAIVRLNTDGTLDNGFAALDLMWGENISGVRFTDDGRLLVSGAGAVRSGALQVGFALLKPDVGPDPTIPTSPTTTSSSGGSGGGGVPSLWFFGVLCLLVGARKSKRYRHWKTVGASE
jgi:uncharacterized delta-60 repeat protein